MNTGKRHASPAHPLLAAAEKMQTQLVAWRRHLHAHPEASREEKATAAFVARELRRLGLRRVRTGVGGHGVVAVVGDPRRGPAVALRADMDALELTEATGAPYASTRPGLMHACGHDGHTAILLGAAALLDERAGELPGAVVFLFQPAEESFGGAREMVKAGCLADPRVRAAAALHLHPYLPSGAVGIRHGVHCAELDMVMIVVRGKSAHAARPNTGVDAIAAAAHVITAIHTFLDRCVDPLEPHVFTVGRVSGGTRVNIIANEVTLGCTLRTLTPAMKRRIARFLTVDLARVAKAFGATLEVDIGDGYPPVVNDEGLVGCLDRAARAVVGPGRVHETAQPSMGGEDFSFYGILGKIPIAMCRLGTRDAKKGFTGMLHSTTFDFDDGVVLPIGAALLAQTAVEMLNTAS